MNRPISMTALRAFAEAGRSGSMKQAAAALGVTPGAVSQQIKQLELRLGLTLFERHNREIRLTRDGQRLLAPVDGAFRQIDDVLASVERAPVTTRTLTVTTCSSFAANWLVPRLGRFNALHPELEVRVETSARLTDLRREGIDVALRHGLGDYPGLAAARFITPHLIPVAAPALLRDRPPITQARDCLGYPLLQDGDRIDWDLWFKAQGIDDARARRGASFEDGFLLVRAAMAGQGIALVGHVEAADEIAAGRLVQVLDLPWPSRFAYYFVTPPETAGDRKIVAFRDWVMAEAAGPAAFTPAPPTL
jgi:LysR family glycine cleavage system transcriptional activator